MIYWINKGIWFLCNPMSVGLCALLLSLGLGRKHRRICNVCILLTLIGFYVLSTGWFVRLSGNLLEKDYPQIRPEESPYADAIVELSGGVGFREKNVMGYPELASAADRVYCAALLWRAGKAPVIVTSCKNVTNTDDVVLRELGVQADAIVSETEATTTEENAKFIQQMLKERWRSNVGGNSRQRVLLVTSAWHMKRSLYMFRKYAPTIDCIPVACDYEVMTKGPLNFRDFIPDPASFELSCRFLHEWLGIVGYHFRS